MNTPLGRWHHHVENERWLVSSRARAIAYLEAPLLLWATSPPCTNFASLCPFYPCIGPFTAILAPRKSFDILALYKSDYYYYYYIGPFHLHKPLPLPIGLFGGEGGLRQLCTGVYWVKTGVPYDGSCGQSDVVNISILAYFCTHLHFCYHVSGVSVSRNRVSLLCLQYCSYQPLSAYCQCFCAVCCL